MNEKKQKIVKNMLNVSMIIWGVYAVLISLASLFPQIFLQFIFGDILLKEAVQNFYQIGEIMVTGIIFFLCYLLSKKRISSVSDKPTTLGILNIIMALFIAFIIPFIFACLSESYMINVLLPESEAAYSCFAVTEKFVEFLNPLLFASVTIFLCAYVVYWVEVSCNRKIQDVEK